MRSVTPSAAWIFTGVMTGIFILGSAALIRTGHRYGLLPSVAAIRRLVETALTKIRR